MTWRAIFRFVRDAAHSMVGIPSYDAYVAHMRAVHPDQPVMDYSAFFKDRQNARFGAKGGGRCC
jgi:uncharacterized short protein YbdD (DUF466 family)